MQPKIKNRVKVISKFAVCRLAEDVIKKKKE